MTLLRTVRYLNSLTIGDNLSLSQIESEIKRSSDYVQSVTIGNVSVDGKTMPLKDFSPETVKKYLAAGTINISSAIMGSVNY